MKCPFCIKVCSKCGELLVAYSGNFNKKKNGKYGLGSQCKKCRKQIEKQRYEENREKILEQKKEYYEENKEEITEKKKQRYEENKEEIAEQHKQYYEENREKILEQKKEYYEENKEEITEYNKKYYEEHKEERLERQKEYYEENKEEIAEKKKEYYEEHREEILEQKKEYYEEHREEILEQKKEYRINNPHVALNSSNKRRQKLENQGRGITKEQWYEMMCWFDWECAYSGIQLKADRNRTIDHIDCLDNGGLNEIWNVVPMHMPYNSSKNDKDILDWYEKQEFYSEEKLQKIYEWCEYAWNKWGYETEEEIVFNYYDLNDETIERYFEEELEEII